MASPGAASPGPHHCHVYISVPRAVGDKNISDGLTSRISGAVGVVQKAAQGFREDKIPSFGGQASEQTSCLEAFAAGLKGWTGC